MVLALSWGKYRVMLLLGYLGLAAASVFLIYTIGESFSD